MVRKCVQMNGFGVLSVVCWTGVSVLCGLLSSLSVRVVSTVILIEGLLSVMCKVLCLAVVVLCELVVLCAVTA